METKTFKSSGNMAEAIRLVTYPGQHPHRRMFRNGYEHYLDSLPVLDDNDPFIDTKVQITKGIMDNLATELKNNPWWKLEDFYVPDPKGFKRIIIGMEEPITELAGLGNEVKVVKEGAELIIANWGDGHTSPVHGHSDGYIHEHILSGRMRVNLYRIVDEQNRIVRPVRTDVVDAGTFASVYKPHREDGLKRMNLVHNFTSIGFSSTLHFIPEHTRDGRDNMFVVDYFEDNYKLTVDDVEQITAKDGLYLQKGEVIMVRSDNVPEYGDHFIVITGHPIVKEHGLRPQEISVMTSPNGISLLDLFDHNMGLTLLKLKPQVRDEFLKFHDIKRDIAGNIVFPEA